jgi:hypothetical protein
LKFTEIPPFYPTCNKPWAGLPNAAHEPRRFLGVGSMRLFGPNRTAALLEVTPWIVKIVR